MSTVPTKNILLLVGLISVSVFIAALIWNDLIYSFFVSLIWDDAQEFAKFGVIGPNFMPIGYSAFLGSCIKTIGLNGVPACQSFIYAGVLFAAFLFLRLRGLQKKSLLVLGVLATAFYPILLLNVWRIHDGNLTTLLLLGFLSSGILFLRSQNTKTALLFGVINGLLFAVRPNTLFLFLAAIFVIFWKPSAGKGINKFLSISIFLAITVFVVMGINVAVKQKFLFFPPQGFYNLFSGANEYSLKYFLKDYVAENSHEEALAAKGFGGLSSFEDRIRFPSEEYKRLALEFIKENPIEYLKLSGIKFITFLRPGYHVTEGFSWFSIEGPKRILKIILALPFFIWIFFLWKTRNNFFDRESLFVFLSAVFYILPFILISADPRYRFPLNIIFILDSFYMWSIIRKSPSRLLKVGD